MGTWAKPLAQRQSPPVAAKIKRPHRILAVGGGKGGIGKSMVSTNLGVALAKAGHKVLLVDADLGGANLHTCLGVPQPAMTLSDFVMRKTQKLEDLVAPTGVENLSLISGAGDALDAANPRPQAKAKLLQALQGLEADYLLLDLGAGTSFNVLDFFIIANHGLLVILPEPTSVENAYRFVKAAMFRRLQHLSEGYGIAHIVEAALSSREGLMRTPLDLVHHVRNKDPSAANRLEMDLRAFRVKLIVNQVRTPADQTVGTAVVSAWKKFFGLDMDYLGAIPYDDEAWRAVRKKKPVLIEKPDSLAAIQLSNVAQKILTLDAPPA